MSHTLQEFPGGVTNGASRYPVYSGMQDWNYLRFVPFPQPQTLQEFPCSMHEQQRWLGPPAHCMFLVPSP